VLSNASPWQRVATTDHPQIYEAMTTLAILAPVHVTDDENTGLPFHKDPGLCRTEKKNPPPTELSRGYRSPDYRPCCVILRGDTEYVASWIARDGGKFDNH